MRQLSNIMSQYVFKMFETCFRWKKGPIVKDERTFGLRLASNKYTEGLPKWDPRSQTAGLYVGMSPNHASSVALVLNLATGHVTLQYHVVFDDDFSTVQYLRTGERPPFWEELVRDNTEHFGIVDPTQRPSRDLDWSNLDWFEGAKVLAKKRQMDEVPEGDPVEGPTFILNGKTTRQELAKKVRFIDEVDVENAKMVQAGSGRRTKLLISKEKRVSPSAPNVHSEEHGTDKPLKIIL